MHLLAWVPSLSEFQKQNPSTSVQKKDPRPLTFNIEVYFYIINKYILLGGKLRMPVMESCYIISAVVNQIFPPTIQKMYTIRYLFFGGFCCFFLFVFFFCFVWFCFVALKKNVGRVLVMPEVQQPTEMDSSASINVFVLPICAVTQMQGHILTHLFWPPAKVALLTPRMLTAHQPQHAAWSRTVPERDD